MLYKEILVVLDDAPGCEERVNVALRLAAHQLDSSEPRPAPGVSLIQWPGPDFHLQFAGW